jgi:hypothetical protein
VRQRNQENQNKIKNFNNNIFKNQNLYFEYVKIFFVLKEHKMATNSMDCIDDGSEYVISINFNEWSELEEHAETKHFLDVNNIVQVRSRKLKGTWIKAFEKK